MPLRPNLIERLLIHNGIIPTALLDTGVSMFQASALLTAGDIRLFNHLKNETLTLEEISKKTSCYDHLAWIPTFTEIVLNTLYSTKH